MNNALYVSIHSHCEFSTLDGMGHVKDWVARAKELGCRSLAISDHGNVDCALELIDECLKQGINPIVGCEAYMVPDMKVKAKSERRGHICLFVQNEEGWNNLLYMLTKANLEGYYRRPRIDFDLLLRHHKGLVISTACVASFLYLEGGMNFFYSLVGEKYGENIYLEVMPHLSEEQAKLNRLCRKLSRDTGVPLVATNDAHYINKDDKETHEVLLAIQRGAKWNDPSRWKFDPAYEIWLKDADEMLEGFRKQGVLNDSEAKLAIMRTTEIAKLCGGFRIPNLGISLPSPPIEKSEEEYFRELCIEGRNKTFGDEWPTKEYEERFEYEYKIITEKNFSRYFIVVKNLLDWCRKNNIMTGPRGSVGCSLIAMLLGITIIDPVKYSLPFDRFINQERCFLGDTVLIVNGVQKKIKNVKIGDTVLNKFSQQDTVVDVRKFAIKEKILKISFPGGEVFCTKDHEWWVCNKYGEIVKKKAEFIIKGEDRLIKIFKPSQIKESGVYMVQNVITGKAYIGGTNFLRRRINEHKTILKYNRHWCKELQDTYNNNPENVKIQILEYVEDDSLLRKIEQFWMDSYNSYHNGYNRVPRSDSTFGFRHSDKTKKLLSDLCKNRPPVSQAFRDKMSEVTKGDKNGMYGKKHSCATKQIISQKIEARGGLNGDRNPNYGNKWSKELREKVSSQIKESGRLNGDRNPNYGNKWSEELKAKASKQIRESGRLKGDRNPNSHFMKRQKEEIIRLHIYENVPIETLAKDYDLKIATIERYIKNAKD